MNSRKMVIILMWVLHSIKNEFFHFIREQSQQCSTNGGSVGDACENCFSFTIHDEENLKMQSIPQYLSNPSCCKASTTLIISLASVGVEILSPILVALL